ncbi:MAG: ribosome-associated translation inhibitor RaiA [Deltaproteobacteria bacterium]
MSQQSEQIDLEQIQLCAINNILWGEEKMKISITQKNVPDDRMISKSYIEGKLLKLNRYFDSPVDVHVILSVEKFRHIAEINMSATGGGVFVKEEAKDMRSAVDITIDKLDRQLKKYLEKKRDSKKDPTQTVEQKGYLMNEKSQELEAEEMMVEMTQLTLQSLSLEEAMREIIKSKNSFFAFRNIKTDVVNIVYRKDNSKYAVIETN